MATDNGKSNEWESILRKKADDKPVPHEFKWMFEMLGWPTE